MYGLASSVIFLATGQIVLCIVVHAIHNVVALVALPLLVRRAAARERVQLAGITARRAQPGAG